MNTTTINKEDSGWLPRSSSVSKVSKVPARDDEMRMRVEEAGLKPPKSDADTFSIRMNNDGFLYELWRGLAAMTVRKDEDDGHYYLHRMKHIKPLMTLEGAMELINMLRFLNNPSVVLGIVKEEEAVVERDHILEAVADRLALDKDFFEVSHTQRSSIMAFLTPLIWHQLSRAIKGHESNNLITHIEEQRGEHSVTQNQGGKRGWFGGAKQ